MNNNFEAYKAMYYKYIHNMTHKDTIELERKTLLLRLEAHSRGHESAQRAKAMQWRIDQETRNMSAPDRIAYILKLAMKKQQESISELNKATEAFKRIQQSADEMRKTARKLARPQIRVVPDMKRKENDNDSEDNS